MHVNLRLRLHSEKPGRPSQPQPAKAVHGLLQRKAGHAAARGEQKLERQEACIIQALRLCKRKPRLLPEP